MALERTFSIIKPDAVAKNAIGSIVAKFEAGGLRVVAQRMVRLTEAQARDRGHDLETERYSFQGLGKANIVGEGGVVKVIAERGGPVLGIHMVGPHVTELISEAMLITNWEAVPAEVAALIHPHPSLSEGIGEAHLALAGKPLHSA